MLWTIAAILFLLWAIGLITSTTFGGFVHVLVVIALVLIIVQLLRRRRSK